MAVRGFIFSSDAAMFMAVLAISAVLVAHFSTATVDTISSQNRVYQMRTSAEHAVNVLLFAAKPEFRCMYGENNIPVPACVWGNGTIQSDWFWVDSRFKCQVQASNAAAETQINAFLGCSGPPPADVETLVVVPFEFCWAGNVLGLPTNLKNNAIRTCTWVEANILVWS